MKALRALMLMLALSVCAYAGNMGNGIVDPPPPPPPAVAPLETDGQDSATAAAADLVTEITLNILQSVLSLF